MPDYLDALLDGARRRVADARVRVPLDALADAARAVASPPSFFDALRGPHVAVIAEIKRASPSKGRLAPDVDARALGERYRDAGAAAISVLTEPAQFLGSLDDLASVASLGVPTLRKDFIVDPYQVWEARLHGAAAVLLIVAALDDETLNELAATADEAGLATLVEVHNEGELARAQRAGAKVIGINARDLHTFAIDRDAFARLRPLIAEGVVAVAESGVRDADDVRRYASLGAGAVLVGESLVTAPDAGSALAALVAAGRGVGGHVGSRRVAQR
ncbi:MAG: indole-3-glycerol phosphate synthase TrpC [Nitriliruptoraceae bacterium]